ncbi:hypothetical protein DFJ58DRAFT_847753 [Suillus subalutaceus]|uniref:uncharacterized protein n=1 Tax=Suillus subalutaceus TaxID=48586 RepID=UPI001B869B69|nr:uncharacterized protein DFJ58DRAFT_847753 [Suillus subalutaceus]KAG1833665.1 hypothetical protein DFJ58DRAFT_847753 [Suillus subalutaceus]
MASILGGANANVYFPIPFPDILLQMVLCRSTRASSPVLVGFVKTRTPGYSEEPGMSQIIARGVCPDPMKKASPEIASKQDIPVTDDGSGQSMFVQLGTKWTIPDYRSIMTITESYSPSQSLDNGSVPTKSIPMASQGWEATRHTECSHIDSVLSAPRHLSPTLMSAGLTVLSRAGDSSPGPSPPFIRQGFWSMVDRLIVGPFLGRGACVGPTYFSQYACFSLGQSEFGEAIERPWCYGAGIGLPPQLPQAWAYLPVPTCQQLGEEWEVGSQVLLWIRVESRPKGIATEKDSSSESGAKVRNRKMNMLTLKRARTNGPWRTRTGHAEDGRRILGKCDEVRCNALKHAGTRQSAYVPNQEGANRQ